MPITELLVLAPGERPLARLRVVPGQLRRWHFGLLTSLAAASAYHWFGLTEAGLAVLGGYAHGQAFVPPRRLVALPGRHLWMCSWLVVIPHSWWRCDCLYRDELTATDYVRLRRLLRRTALQPSGEPLDLPRFDQV